MYSSRVAARSLTRLPVRHNAVRATRRFQSTTGGQGIQGGSSSAVIGGVAGGSLVFTIAYAWYHISGAKSIVNTVHTTKQYYQDASKKLNEKTPDTDESLSWLQETATSYAAFFPGGKKYVEAAFNDLNAIREKNKDKVDDIIKGTYDEIRSTTKSKGISVETAQQVWTIIEKRLGEVSELASEASEQILNNHPELKNKLGGSIDELKSYSDEYVPQVKDEVNKTWDQIRSIISKGVTASTAYEIRNVVEEKKELFNKMKNEAFNKGMEQAKPYLEKAPEAKKLVEENASALKQGNLGQLWEKVKQAASTGDTKDLEQFVKQSVDKAKSSGFSSGGLESTLQQIPGAGSIAPQIKKLVDIGQEHGDEARDLLKKTAQDIEDILKKRVSEAEQLANKGKKSWDNSK